MIEYKIKKKVSSSQIDTTIPNDKPIVFWDTCSLLYIISIPLRDAFGDYNVYSQLLKHIEDGDILSVTSTVVFEEFKQHADVLYNDILKDESRLVNIYKNYAKLIGDPDKTVINDAASRIHLSDILVDVSNRVWSNTYVINEDNLYKDIAHYRVMNKMSPAREKGEYKDSYIWASFMNMSQKLNNGLLRAFMTDNTEDYCDFEGKKVKGLQPQIEIDCNTVNAEFFWKTRQLYHRIREVLGLP